MGNEACDLLEEYKEKIRSQEPTDLSDLLSKIDVHLQRLHVTAIAHCKARWNGRSRQMLSQQELEIYLAEVAISEPIPPGDDFSNCKVL